MERTAALSSPIAHIMKRIINQSPTGSRRLAYYSNTKESKRVKWTEVSTNLY